MKEKDISRKCRGTDQLHGAMHLLAGGCPEAIGLSQLRRGGDYWGGGDGDRVEASVLGDVAQQPG